MIVYAVLELSLPPVWKTSMEFHGGLGHQFHGKYLHRKGCHGIAWRIRKLVSMEISPSIVSIKDLDIFHGIP